LKRDGISGIGHAAVHNLNKKRELFVVLLLLKTSTFSYMECAKILSSNIFALDTKPQIRTKIDNFPQTKKHFVRYRSKKIEFMKSISDNGLFDWGMLSRALLSFCGYEAPGIGRRKAEEGYLSAVGRSYSMVICREELVMWWVASCGGRRCLLERG